MIDFYMLIEFINVHASSGFSLTQEHGNIHIAKIAK